jgi:small GTP-binding protein
LTTEQPRSDDAGVIQRKVAMLGAPGVGKTSLVRQFVLSLFDDQYLTTIGVKVDKKQLQVRGEDTLLMLWDVAGAEAQAGVPMSYVRGASGYLLVVDPTRPATLEIAADIGAQIARDLGPLPHVLVLNKADLADQWQLDDEALARSAPASLATVRTSARTGAGVEQAFTTLAEALAR